MNHWIITMSSVPWIASPLIIRFAKITSRPSMPIAIIVFVNMPLIDEPTTITRIVTTAPIMPIMARARPVPIWCTIARIIFGHNYVLTATFHHDT